MAVQYSYVMKDLTKIFPGAQKPVLNNINLASDASYYYYSGYNYHSNNNADDDAKPTGKADRRKQHTVADVTPAIKPKY